MRKSCSGTNIRDLNLDALACHDFAPTCAPERLPQVLGHISTFQMGNPAAQGGQWFSLGGQLNQALNEDVRQRRKHAKKRVLSNFISLHFQNFEGCLVILIKCFIVQGHGHFLSFCVNIDLFSHFQEYISSQYFQWSNSVSRICLYWHINIS